MFNSREEISFKNQFLPSERNNFFTSTTSRFYLFKFDEKLTEVFFNGRFLGKTINKIKFGASNGKFVKLSLTHSRTKIYAMEKI